MPFLYFINMYSRSSASDCFSLLFSTPCPPFCFCFRMITLNNNNVWEEKSWSLLQNFYSILKTKFILRDINIFTYPSQADRQTILYFHRKRLPPLRSFNRQSGSQTHTRPPPRASEFSSSSLPPCSPIILSAMNSPSPECFPPLLALLPV